MRSKTHIVEIAHTLFEEELSEIRITKNGIGEAFSDVALLIADLPSAGRLLVTGIGKAGYIAMKLSASLASIGIRSFFVHPSEALHGDLGRFAPDDIVIIFSNSGETEEVICLLPSLRAIGCKIISVTSTTSSTLAKKSDFVLPIGSLKEIGQHRLAPTTSSAAMLILSDVLTMTVMEIKQYSEHDFARTHPGGNIGRALMPLSEVMRTGESHCVVDEQTICRDVLHRYTATPGRPGCATIVDKDGRLSGIFTDGNLRRCLDTGMDFLSKPIVQVMTKSPKTISSNKLAREALQVLSEHQIDQLVVIDHDRRPVGLIDIQDVARIFTSTGI